MSICKFSKFYYRKKYVILHHKPFWGGVKEAWSLNQCHESDEANYYSYNTATQCLAPAPEQCTQLVYDLCITLAL